jgi:hypothetical protein
MNYSLNYGGRQLNFNREYLENVVKAFKENALGEQTVFQLADDDNAHDTQEDRKAGRNFDPQRFRGEIIDTEVRSDGLYIKLDPTDEGRELLNKNKKLAVSASLREQYPSHNGKTYPVVLRHVLGTHDPKIRGMGHWQEADVSLANDEDVNEEVIDLTTTEPNKAEKVEVPKDEWDAMKKFMADSQKEDAELEELVKNILESDDASEESKETANLSETAPDPKLIQLANEVASERFERRADAWRRAGVPNKMIELARPALSSGFEFEISLSNGATTDGKAILSAMLDEAQGTIDMSEQKSHVQSQEDKSAEEQEAKEAAKYFSSLAGDDFNGSFF